MFLLLVVTLNSSDNSAIVHDLYDAAHRQDTKAMQKIITWCKNQQKINPVPILEKSISHAIEIQHDAYATELLTLELEQAKMGSWERYYRGITLIATGVIIAAMLGFKSDEND